MAAVGSYLDALEHNGEWLLRMEDLDPPREVAGAASAILASLEAHGFEWAGAVTYQSSSECQERYRAALNQLQSADRLYACSCTRKRLAAQRSVGNLAYPGTCRTAGLDLQAGWALRFVIPAGDQHFTDRLQGPQSENLARTCGDFVVRRRDGLIAYQLAVVVDDADQGITHVVRGSDLLDSTARQLGLQQALGYSQPAYMHLPVIVGPDGDKLSKQTGAAALDDRKTVCNLVSAYRLLNPVRSIPEFAAPHEFWVWAARNWRSAALPKVRSIAADRLDRH